MMREKVQKNTKGQGSARRMECNRREVGSSESMEAKEATKTKPSWKQAPKAVIKEETAEAVIKEEKVKAAIAKCQKKELKT